MTNLKRHSIFDYVRNPSTFLQKYKNSNKENCSQFIISKSSKEIENQKKINQLTDLAVNNKGEIFLFNSSEEDLKKIRIDTNIYVIKNYPDFFNKKHYSFDKNENKFNKFIIIKALTEEDIHKSIKYGIWCSTRKNNEILTNLYKTTNDKGGFVYLFVSATNSGRFSGVCKLKSGCDFNKTFKYWSSIVEWQGIINVEWIIIKDLPNKAIKEENFITLKGESLVLGRDCSEIDTDTGINFLYFYSKFILITSILQHFQYYDERELEFKEHENENNSITRIKY